MRASVGANPFGHAGLRLFAEFAGGDLSELSDALARSNGASEVSLDLSGLTFIDSGLHAIVSFARSRQPNQRVTLEQVSPLVMRLFEITQLDELPNLRVHGRD